MNKYISLSRYELKTIIRDPFHMFLCAFPFILLFISVYLFPALMSSMEQDSAELKYTTLIILMILVTFGTFITGAMGSFMLLEHKDERTLNTISVTPVGASGYLMFKLTYIYLLSVVSILVILVGTKLLASDAYAIGGVSLLDNIGSLHILTYALVMGLFAPSLALLQSAFARNKVEGYALVKGTGTAAMIPLVMIMDAFMDGTQYILGIFPNFWSLKGFMLTLLPNNSTSNLSYTLYLIIGALYSLVLLLVCYKLFLKKVSY